MVRDGRGRILVNDKDVMDRITREIFEDDEESGISIAELNWTEAERGVCVFYCVKIFSMKCSILLKHWLVFKVYTFLVYMHTGTSRAMTMMTKCYSIHACS